MGAQLEPCQLHTGGLLTAVRFAPADRGADLYWPRLPDVPVAPGQAVTVRSRLWLVDWCAQWFGRPGGTHAHVLEVNASGTLRRYEAGAATGYGVPRPLAGESAVLGVLLVTGSDEQVSGGVSTTAEWRPVGAWAGGPRDELLLSDGTEWEQVGDPIHRTAGPASTVPVVRLRRLHDGQQD